MVSAILTIGGLGLVSGLGLAVASKVFYVYVDPLIIAVEESLPGANCGGCGFPGCSGAAEAIATGKAPPNVCVGGGPDTHAKVGVIMGIEVKEVEPEIARPGCYYGPEKADLKFNYDGLNNCRAAMLLGGGPKICPVGCIGLGSCANACPFGALSMGHDGLPVVNPDLCTGCGTCERVCPKHIITLSSHSRRILQEYTTDECTAPCQRTCPAGIDIPSYIHEIARGNYLEAVRVIKEKNPLPLVCGRICVHPCEFECRRNLIDEPVAINYLKRFAADYEMNQGERIQLSKAPATERKVAVVGGGAEGLTTAAFLARLGHDPTIYEGMSKLGGLLQTVIPDSRLPKDVLDWEIQGILDLGVTAVTNQKLGRDFTISSLLQEGFEAVFVATGGWDSQMAEGLPKESVEVLPGVQLLVPFTFSWAGGNRPQVGRKVMIVGGGNASLDAARLAKQLGAEQVGVVFREARTETPFTDEEFQAAETEGIRLYFHAVPVKMLGQENRLTAVQLANLEGLPKVTTMEALAELEAIEEVAVDSLLTGAGRFPELIYASIRPECQGAEEEQTHPCGPIRWETVLPYAGPFAEHDIGIFRPGEVTSDYKAVVEAIGSGRRGAISVHKQLLGQAVAPPDTMIRRRTQVLSVSELEPISTSSRQRMPELGEAARVADPHTEVELGLTEQQAREEAARCLRCGLICYRRVEDSREPAKSA